MAEAMGRVEAWVGGRKRPIQSILDMKLSDSCLCCLCFGWTHDYQELALSSLLSWIQTADSPEWGIEREAQPTASWPLLPQAEGQVPMYMSTGNGSQMTGERSWVTGDFHKLILTCVTKHCMWCVPLIPTVMRQRQADLFKFEASLVCIEYPRPARTT